MDVDGAAAVLAEQLVIDETRDVVYWQAPGAEPRQTGLHDCGALYAVSGLYEAVYLVRLGVRSPQLLAEVLASVCPSGRRAQLQVLDIGAGAGAGTGCVGAALSAAGFQRIASTDLEPAGITAIGRDRGDTYTGVRAIDLTAPTPADLAWLTQLAPDVVTVAGAIGWGHLPVAALHTLTRLLRPGAERRWFGSSNVTSRLLPARIWRRVLLLLPGQHPPGMLPAGAAAPRPREGLGSDRSSTVDTLRFPHLGVDGQAAPSTVPRAAPGCGENVGPETPDGVFRRLVPAKG